jgi:hypothetical protein
VSDLDALTDIILRGPDLAGEPAGEWGRTIARGYARRVLAAGWRPPLDVPPAECAPSPPVCQTAPPPPAGGTPHLDGAND